MPDPTNGATPSSSTTPAAPAQPSTPSVPSQHQSGDSDSRVAPVTTGPQSYTERDGRTGTPTEQTPFNADEFLRSNRDNSTIEHDPNAPTFAEQLAEKGIELGDPSQEQPPQFGQPRQTQPRDLTGIPPQHHAVAKQMSREAFGVFKTYLKNYEEAKAELDRLREESGQWKDASYTDHEEAFTLSPEYRDLAATVRVLNEHQNHWQEQLAKIQAGEPWKNLEWNPQTKTFDERAYEPDPTSQAHVIAQISSNAALMNDYRSKLNSFPDRFKGQVSTYQKGLEDIEKEVLGNVDLSKLKPQIDSILSKLPAYARNRRETRLLATFGVLLNLYGKEAQRGQQTDNSLNRVQRSRGPTGADVVSGAQQPVNGDQLFSRFQRVLRGQ